MPELITRIKGITHVEAMKRIAELEAENERLREAAERYQWLRKGLRLEYIADLIEDGEIENSEGLDNAIDAARKGEGE